MSSRSFRACVLCHRAAVVTLRSRGMSTAPNPQSQADFLQGNPHKKHPGLSNLKTVRLPDELQVAARSIISEAKVAKLPERAQSLTNYLWSRKRTVESRSLQKKAVALEKKLWEEAVSSREDFDELKLGKRIQRKVPSELKRTTYHWTALKYDAELSLVYMAARLAGGYAAVRRALHEIKKKDPSFAPKTLLDFGSGLGTVAWASHLFWGDTLKELVCVDSSGPMNILAERLLKGDDESAEPHIKHVYFRQFLPVSPKVQFDLVTSAFTLAELATKKEREDAVQILWRKTSSYLVLVENGTKEGHQMLMEAKDTILKKKDSFEHDDRPASVFAPCPHEKICPKLTQEPVKPCNFWQQYESLPLPQHQGHQLEKFIYLIMRRAAPSETEAGGVEWARLIAPVLRRTRHVHCQMCCPDGQLQQLVVTAKKHGRDVYRCARNSNWGDQMPMIQKVNEDTQSDSE